MEKPSTDQGLAKFIVWFERAKEALLHPDTLWRVVLYVVLSGIIIIGIFAYTTYIWASGHEETTPSHVRGTTLSLSDLKHVIAAYDAKVRTYEDLLSNGTSTPSPDFGSRPAVVPSADGATTTATTT